MVLIKIADWGGGTPTLFYI